MKTPYFLKNRIAASEEENFEMDLLADNLRRGKVLAILSIAFESVFILADIITSILRVDSRFAFAVYLAMYFTMMAVNAVYFLIIRRFDAKDRIPKDKKGLLTILLVGYMTFVMSWGSVVALLDQRLYGQIIAFMVNIIVCSFVYLLDNRKIVIPYVISVLILVIGLPYFQPSKDILIGHYVNLAVFITISFLASRMIYDNYCQNYTNRALLNQANLLVERELEENKKINIRLELANNQLKKLALLDDLTELPNRRSFREFMDRTFDEYAKACSTLSIIMADIDFFKQYNDYYGHEEGDKTLVAVANQIHSVVEQANEFAVRWGGEEFIYAVFDRSQEEVLETANRISAKVSDLKILHEASPIGPHVSISLGVSTMQICEKKDISRVIKLADEALYLAKSRGRNRIESVNGAERPAAGA